MSVNLESGFRRYSSKPGVQRTGVFVLSALVLGYLAIIIFFRFAESDSLLRVLQLGVLWCLGLVALVLLVRLYRKIPLSRD